MERPLSTFGRLVLALGFLFLYVPIAILILYSFNASRLVTVWGGFSFAWYETLLNDRQLIDSALLSLKIASVSASLATFFAVFAAIALTRQKPRASLTMLAALINAPLVMPEIILGLALLLLFVAFDLPRGFWTVTLAHAALGTAFGTVVIRSRLRQVDRRLEEAAMDLGCPPWRVFFLIILPLIAPSLIAAWLLTFTLSLDDLIIASFTTGPGATTLPMRIYSAVRLGVSPQINAVSALMLVGVATVLALIWTIVRPHSSRRENSR